MEIYEAVLQAYKMIRKKEHKKIEEVKLTSWVNEHSHKYLKLKLTNLEKSIEKIPEEHHFSEVVCVLKECASSTEEKKAQTARETLNDLKEIYPDRMQDMQD